jgi:uncharacterized membrane protein (UPF0127 family)
VKSPLRVVNRTRQAILVEEGAIASNLWTRLVGLMGRRTLPRGTGLLLKGEQAIHTFGMFIPIDVLYLDAEQRVVRAVNSMRPSRVGPLVRKARDVLELPAGTLLATGTREGDQLVFE